MTIGRAYWDNSMSSLLYTESDYVEIGDNYPRGYRVLKDTKKYTYIDVTRTVLPIHTYFDGVDYLFSKRHGAEWNFRLTDYRDGLDRTQIGQTFVAGYESIGDCTTRNCSFNARKSDQTWHKYVWGK